MKRRAGWVLMAAGILCLMSAVLLTGYNRQEDRTAGAVSRELLTQLEQNVQRTEPEHCTVLPPVSPEPIPTELPEPEPGQLEVVTVDGLDYIGTLRIPDLEIELPVLARWSEQLLHLAPCRYAGDLSTGDLVLTAHNYMTHFGRIASLPPGSPVEFADVHQNPVLFEVRSVEIFRPDQVEEMTAGEYPLTLFTCTYGGRSRVAVRCRRISP